MISLIRFTLIVIVIVIPFCSLFAETANMNFTIPASLNNLQVSNDGQTILASISGNSTSVWYSSDAGANWECLNSKLFDVHNLVYRYLYPFMVGPNEEDIVVFCPISNSDTLHILYSNNGGDSFIDRTPTIWEEDVRKACFTVDSFFNDTWAIQSETWCYYTFDSGEHWECVQSTAVTGGSLLPEMIVSDPVVMNTYYNISHFDSVDSGIHNDDMRIFRSQQGIYNWDLDNAFIQLNSQLGTFQSEISNFLPLSNGIFLAYVQAQSETDDWTVNRLVTFDNTGTFLHRSGGDYNLGGTLFEDRLVPGRVYSLGSDLFVSNDFGLTWEIVSFPSLPADDSNRIRSFYQVQDGSSYYCAVNNNGIYNTPDLGTDWAPVNTFLLPRFRQLYAQDEDIIYYGNGGYWLRQPSGTEDLITISLTGHPDSTYSLEKIGYCNEDTLIGTAYVYPYSELIPHMRLYGTYDGGESWPLMCDIGEQYFTDLYFLHTESFSSSGCHFIAYQDDYIKYSSDFGMTWETLPEITIDDTPASRSLFAHYEDNIYVLAYNDYLSTCQIFKFDFQSNGWISTSFPQTRTRIYSMVANENSLTVVNGEGSIYRYTGGSTWSTLLPLPDSSIYCNLVSKYVDCESPFTIYHIQNMNELLVLKNNMYSWYPVEIEYPYGLTIHDINSIQYDPIRERIWLGTEYGLFWFPVEYILSSPEDPIQVIPSDPELLTNYPNPFNASTRICYNLTQPGNVKLDVYDITGRLVKTLMDDYQSAGIQNVFLDGTGLASGTYFIRLNTGTEVRNKKITLIK